MFDSPSHYKTLYKPSRASNKKAVLRDAHHELIKVT